MSFVAGTALIVAGVGMAASAWKTNQAKQQADTMAGQARTDALRWEKEMNRIKENRPTVTNPYANMTNAFGNALFFSCINAEDIARGHPIPGFIP